MNYEFNLLQHVGVVTKRLRAAAAETGAAATHEGEDNAPSGPTGRGVKIPWFPWFIQNISALLGSNSSVAEWTYHRVCC